MCNAALAKTTIPVQCKWNCCNLEFETARRCLDHLRKSHDLKQGNGICQWKGCDYKSSISGIRNHIKKHFDLVEACCTLCKTEINFKWRFDLNKHLAQFHKDVAYQVDVIEVDGFDTHIARRKQLSPFLAKIMN